MTIDLELIRETEARYAERQAIRQEREAKLRAGAILEADTPERVRKRIEHVARMIIETEGAPSVGQGRAGTIEVLERIIGRNDLMSLRYLELAIRVARTVGRVHVRGADGSEQGFGTGFLVSPRLLLTNNHVLDTAAAAGASRVEFDFQENADGRLRSSIFLNLDPAAFFATDRALDFTLVAVKGDPSKIASFGWNGLSAAEGKVIVGEYVTIIQHPDGARKQVALRENRIVDVLENFLHYHTDTSPGSSGSPVFNDQWEVVALHHSGVPKKDAQGRVLTRDNKVWDPSMGKAAIHWVANEGVRISRILKHVQALSLSGAQATLRQQLVQGQKGWQPGSAPAREQLVVDGAASEATDSTWKLPLQLTIGVGGSTSPIAAFEVPLTSMRPPAPVAPEVAESLVESVLGPELQPGWERTGSPVEAALEWLTSLDERPVTDGRL
jgi:V8-like Glu-specific endopeptidase